MGEVIDHVQRGGAGVDKDDIPVMHQLGGPLADGGLGLFAPPAAHLVGGKHLLVPPGAHAAVDLFHRAPLEQLHHIPADGVHRDIEVLAQFVHRGGALLQDQPLHFQNTVSFHGYVPPLFHLYSILL